MPDATNAEKQPRPMLRLRPEALNRPNQIRVSKHPRDGPWMPDASSLEGEARSAPHGNGPVGITMEEYRASFKEKSAQTLNTLKELKATKRLNEFEIQFVVIMWPPVDMMRIDGWTENEIESALEKYYVGAQQYMAPARMTVMRSCDANYAKLSHAQQYRESYDDRAVWRRLGTERPRYLLPPSLFSELGHVGSESLDPVT